MERFLTLVARDLLGKFGTNLSGVEVVFPNKRAGLFMNQALAELSPTPVWAPRYQTISELFHSLSDYEVCDPIQAVCELYRVYADQVAEPETADRFYGWGEILLADFDDIDKHLADARALFSNIRSLKELDGSDFLTSEQERALNHFFEGFSIEGNSRLKEKFLHMWNAMGDIYAEYRRRLQGKGLLYEGALYRDVAEKLAEDSPLLAGGKTYAFVGFNVLDDVEQRLFGFLQSHGRALFYWDYDWYYATDNLLAEAGTFIRENLRRFPNCLPETVYDNFRHHKEIDYIAASSENAQARFLPQWLRKNLTERENETAVVLCNEGLLPPVLHSIPSGRNNGGAERLNVTMGYPLTDTPVYGFVNALLELQTDGYDAEEGRFRAEQRERVEAHPYTAFTEKSAVFAPAKGNTALLDYLLDIVTQVATHPGRLKAETRLQPLYNETLFQAHGILNRFRRLTEEGILDVLPSTLKRLVRAAMESSSVPFHGEPATGLQVMGVLETRNLDFRHLVVLSVNEGRLPQRISNTSFIPYNLREVFGLTTVRHKTAVYAFYFYRLLQRAEKVTLLYNVSADGTGQGEMSRFMQQLLAETDIPIRAYSLDCTPGLPHAAGLQAEKTVEVMRILQGNYDERCPSSRPLSPSALNDYIDCPLRFYYRQVARLRIHRTPADGLDAALFGTIFHASAEGVYKKLTETKPIITRNDLERLLERPDLSLAPFVDAAFAEQMAGENPGGTLRYDGNLVVARRVVLSYLKQLLEYDLRQTPFELKEMEQTHQVTVRVPTPRGDLHVRIGGIVDRMDVVKMPDPDTGELLDTVRIMDYKTGGKPEKPKSMEQLAMPADDRPHYSFQTFLYAWVVCHETRRPVMPALFFVNKSHGEDYSPAIPFDGSPLTDFHAVKDDFTSVLRRVLEELFDPARPFTQTTRAQACTFCDFKAMCGKK